MTTSKMEVYKIKLVEEFIRQFNFLIELANNRASQRVGSHGDFIDKTTSLFKSAKSFTLGVIGIFIPGMGAIDRIISNGLDWINLKRKEEGVKALGELDIDADPKELKILLDTVAQEASRRYEFIINQLSDNPNEGIIPLVKTQALRMIAYLAKNHLSLTEKNLLNGILVGHSGRFFTGFTNHHVKLKSQPSMKISAEAVCGKPAFVVMSNTEPQVWLSSIHHHKPEYGFIIVPKSVAVASDYLPADKNDKHAAKIYQLLEDYHPKIQMICKKDIEDYLQSLKTSAEKNLSFKEFIKNKKQNPNLQTIIFEPEDKADLDLSNLDLSHANFNDCNLNGIKVRGDIVGTKFKRCFLRGADFSGVNATEANFKGAHLERVEATQANFSDANLEEAKLSYGNFEKANFENTKTLAAKWTGANLKGCATGSFFKPREHVQLRAASNEESLSMSPRL